MKMRPLLITSLITLLSLAWPVRAEPSAATEKTTKLLSEHPLSERVDRYLSENVNNGFSGTALIAQHGEITLSKGYGLANKEMNTPNTAETVFDIGSITKQFTGAAILKLVQTDKLKVADTLGTFFEAVPADKQDITLHQLLTHTSGLTANIDGDYDWIETDTFIKNIFKSKLEHKPGETFLYSNIGYSLLGLIIEKVSGQDYEAFVNEHLFQPAGMTHTGYLIPDWSTHPLAHGYKYSSNSHWGTSVERWAEDGGVAWHLKGNGGILSTVEDMYKWHVALEAHSILPPDLLALYQGEHIETKPGRYYGYGWRKTVNPDGPDLIFHSGGNTIFVATFARFQDEAGTVILIMNNEAHTGIYKMLGQVRDMAFDPSLEPTPLSKPSFWNRLKSRVIN